jgi:predicted protein tyrosine phosphatase
LPALPCSWAASVSGCSAKNVLFICGRGRLRSPTAEQVFSRRSDLETASAGISGDADNPLTAELVDWADVIFVMEKTHRTKLQKSFRANLRSKRVVCLDIPDRYGFMDPALVRLLASRLSRYL